MTHLIGTGPRPPRQGPPTGSPACAAAGPAGARRSPVVVTPAGLAPEAWRPLRERFPSVAFAELAEHQGAGPGTPLLVFSAHPDDETIGAGRLVASWVERIGPCTAVLATCGEACVDHVTRRPPRLGAHRVAEWRRATGHLGVTDRMVLGLPDGQLERMPAELTHGVEAVLAQVEPRRQRPVLLAPYAGDPHPDHRAVGEAVSAAARRLGWPLLQYPVWLTYWTDPAQFQGSLQRVRVTADAERAHQAAVACFGSQLRPLAPSLTAVVPPGMLAHHREQLLVDGGPR